MLQMPCYLVVDMLMMKMTRWQQVAAAELPQTLTRAFLLKLHYTVHVTSVFHVTHVNTEFQNDGDGYHALQVKCPLSEFSCVRNTSQRRH
jgi:hypothetical protein